MADEHKQVAAIVCMDIDIMAKVAENESLDADFLRGYMKMIKEKKDEVVNDPKKRELRFNAMCIINEIINEIIKEQ